MEDQRPEGGRLMEITWSQVLRVISRYKNEVRYLDAVSSLKITFILYGPKAAMQHARRIAAAYRNVRAHRIESKTQALKRQAEREGLRYV
jgi:hypothetical protein